MLLLRISEDYTPTFVRHDLRTGVDQPLLALNRLYKHAIGYGLEVSPDGKWLLWKNGQEETHWATLDGRSHFHVQGSIMDKILWMADSRHWVELTNESYPSRAAIYPIKTPGASGVDEISLGSAPAEANCGMITLDNALITTSGHLLVKRMGGEAGITEIVELDLTHNGTPGRSFKVRLPADVDVGDLAFSLDGEHAAWLLRRESRMWLCVSRLNGSQMHLIGAMTITPKDPANPDDVLNDPPSSLHWMPDGKRLTFVYKQALYRVSADLEGGQTVPVPKMLQPVADSAATRQAYALTEALWDAVSQSEAAKVNALIGLGAAINGRNQEGWNALMFAACRSDTGIAERLLDAGADPNLRDNEGDTALIFAAEYSSQEMALLLIERGVRVNVKGRYAQSALLLSAGKGSADVVSALLRHGANPNTVNYDGETPLIAAAKGGFLPIVEMLLAHGAWVNARDKWNGTALIESAVHNHADVCKALLQHGADPNAQLSSEKTNGDTALTYAAHNGNVEICRLLLDKGADVNGRVPAGYTALAFAMMDNHPDVVRFLLEKGSDPNLEIIDSTVLIGAVINNRIEIVKALLQHGAKLEAKGMEYGRGKTERKTPLEWAKERHLEDIVSLLKQAGAKE